MRNKLSVLLATALGALLLVPAAFADHATDLATAHPPEVDTATLLPIIFGVAAVMLAAVLVVIGPALLAKVPFAIVNLVRKAIKSFMGRTAPSAK